MRIISFVNGNSGPSYHRCMLPLILMEGVDVFVTNNLLEEQFDKGCGLFVYNRILPTSAEPVIQKLKEKHGFKICVDVDDYWELDPHHVLYNEYQQIGFAAIQIDHIKKADLVTTTHGRLRDEIRRHNKNVYVLPNAIPHIGQFDLIRKPHHLTRLFWQGSVTHRADIELLRKPIDNLKDIAGKIKMVIAGWAEGEPEWDQMTFDYTSGYKHQYQILPGLHVKEYYQHYENACVCLCPLLDSRFNSMKSNLKVLEAANLGLPVICSQVDPYKDLPVLYARNAAEWERQIRRLVGSRKRQKEAGAVLKEFCDLHFNFEKINKERKQIFEYEYAKNLTL